MEKNLFAIQGIQNLTKEESLSVDGGLLVAIGWWLVGSLAWSLIDGGYDDFMDGFEDGWNG